MKKKDTINIIIADDKSVFIEGVQFILSKYRNFKIIDTYENGLELLQSPKLIEADLLLIDIEMPVMNGLEAAIRINYRFPNLPMIALTMHKEKIYLKDILGAGFKGFVHKPEVPIKLIETIEKVLHNSFAVPEDLKMDEYTPYVVMKNNIIK